MTAFDVGQRVYTSTGIRSHIINVITPRGAAITHCGLDDATTDLYPDRNHSLQLCGKCEKQA